MKLRKPWQQRTAARVGAAFLRTLGATWRVHNLAPTADPPPGIWMFLHGNILMAAHVHRDHGHPILISTHRDGEIIAQVAERMGFRTIRGSSTRGGTRAVLEMLREHRDRPLAVTPDGPRGPRASVKPGLVQLAARGGWPLIPLGFAAARARRLDSWDRFTIPRPFTRIVCVPGDPIAVPSHAATDDATCAALAAEASAALLATDAAAEAELRRITGRPERREES